MRCLLSSLAALWCLTAQGAGVYFTFTNSVGAPDTNAFQIIPISTPLLPPSGSYVVTGVPRRVVPNSGGYVATNLMLGNYLATNQFLGSGVLFAVPDSTNVYNAWKLRISGGNVYNYTPGVLALTSTNGSVTVSSDTGVVDLAIAGLANFVTNASTTQTSTNQILKSPAIDTANITGSTIIAPVLPSGLSLIGSFTWGPGEPLISTPGPMATTNAGQVQFTYNFGLGTNIQVSGIAGDVLTNNRAGPSTFLGPATNGNGLTVTNKTLLHGPLLIDGSGTNGNVSSPPFATVSAKGILNGLSGQTNNGKMFGPDTVGTTTSGLQEAIDSFPKGMEWGPSAASVNLKLDQGYFLYTNAITYSNIYTTMFKIEGSSLLDTKLVYAGNATGINTIWLRGGGHAGASLDLPLHVLLRDVGFTAINETTNILVCLTNVSAIEIESCQFTSWKIMTNTDWGSAVSINGFPGYSGASQGLVGLVAGNANDHAMIVNHCYFAGLATGGRYFTDHLYMDVIKFAFIGVNGDLDVNNLWPTASPYSLGACILRHPGLDSHYQKPHFYSVHAGIVLPEAGGDVQYYSEPVFESCDFPLAAVSAGTVPFRKNDPLQGGEAATDATQETLSVVRTSPTYGYVATNLVNVKQVTYENLNGTKHAFSGQLVGNGPGLTNLNITTSFLPTNALSTWPTVPQSRGGAALVNSNGTVFMLTSGPASLTWAATNKIAGP